MSKRLDQWETFNPLEVCHLSFLLIFLDNVVKWVEMTWTWLVRISTGDCLLPASDIEKIPSSTFTINIYSSSKTCVTLLKVVFSPRGMYLINYYKSINWYFPKGIFWRATSQWQFPKWQLPICAISQVTSSQRLG